MSENAKEAKLPENAVELRFDDGSVKVMSDVEFESLLKSEARIMGATVSVKESRPRAQYQTHERFLSATIDFTNSWTLVDYTKGCGPDAYRAARTRLGQVMTKKILETENTLYTLIADIQKRDGITPYNRTAQS